jgi:hypothetical protein
MLQVQTVMPFIVQTTLHIPPAIIEQRFCIMVQAAVSSQLQVSFMPPATFSNFMVQRGTMTMFVAAGMAGLTPLLMPLIPIMPLIRSLIVLVMITFLSPVLVRRTRASSLPAVTFDNEIIMSRCCVKSAIILANPAMSNAPLLSSWSTFAPSNGNRLSDI